MAQRRFLISSLAAAGFLTGGSSAPGDVQTGLQLSTSDPGLGQLPILGQRARLSHSYILAGHRSHSSHRSHGSHRSHSSGSSSGYSTYPSRNTNSTPPSSVLPSSPSAAPKTLPGNSDKFRKVVVQVQTALFVRDYYSGGIDGIIGPETKSAISRYQKDANLSITGTVTPELLDALGILAE